jgi:hypothetical protein
MFNVKIMYVLKTIDLFSSLFKYRKDVFIEINQSNIEMSFKCRLVFVIISIYEIKYI